MERDDIFSNASCPGKLEVPTMKEKEALDAMRSIKERVRELKKRLVDLKASGAKNEGGQIVEIEENLARLKEHWNQWEGKRQLAAKERMILLGHERD